MHNASYIWYFTFEYISDMCKNVQNLKKVLILIKINIIFKQFQVHNLGFGWLAQKILTFHCELNRVMLISLQNDCYFAYWSCDQ